MSCERARSLFYIMNEPNNLQCPFSERIVLPAEPLQPVFDDPLGKVKLAWVRVNDIERIDAVCQAYSCTIVQIKVGYRTCYFIPVLVETRPMQQCNAEHT